MRRGEDTLMPNWALDAIERLTLAADIRVLIFLTRHRHYRGNTFSTKQIAIALELDPRTTQASTARLLAQGLILSLDGQHCGMEAASRVQRVSKPSAKPLQKDSRQSAEKADQDAVPGSLNKGTDEERKKGIKDPPTPQGDEAREDAAPGGSAEQEHFPAQRETARSPDGEAADAAGTGPAQPSQVQLTPPGGKKNDATSSKKVPRGAAAFDPLTLALPEAVPADTWADWCSHRREIRKPLTERAARLTLAALDTAVGQGWDAGQLIAEAITNGWTGCVFEKHRESAPAPRHIVKFPARRPQTPEEANARFTQNMAANADAVRGVFDD